MTAHGWEVMITSACFDLETSSLNANFGVILVGVVKPADGEPKVFRADNLNKEWKTKRSDDSAVVQAIRDELLQYDILVAHNGARYDIPFMRTRMALWGMGSFPSKKLVDPYQIARNRFRMSSNSLDSLSDLMGTKHKKTPVRGQLWMKAAMDGDRKAMQYITDHCIIDVLILEELVDKVKDYSSVFDNRGSGW